jgi:hypothetical protein
MRSDGGSAPAAVVAAARRLAADALAGEVVDALGREGIRTILLKGPATTRWLYDEGATRVYRDVDLLVAPADLRRAEDVLAHAGFRYHLEAVAPSEQVPHARRWLRPGQTVSVDLHHTLPGVGADGESVWNVLTASTERCEVGGAEIEILAEPARALLLALHAASHGVGADQPVADLSRGVARLPEGLWREASNLARALDAHAAFTAGLGLVPAGTAMAARIGGLTRMPVDVVLRATSPPETAFGFERLAAARGARAKTTLLARELVPTPAFMRAWSPLAARGGRGLALAYLWRPIWLLRRGFRGLAAWRRATQEVRRQQALASATGPPGSEARSDAPRERSDQLDV